MGTMGVFMVILLFLGAAESAGDFDLTDAFDSGQPSQIDQGKESCPNDARDIVFVIDGSTSVTSIEFMQMKAFLVLFMKSFPDNTQCNIRFRILATFMVISHEDCLENIMQWSSTKKLVQTIDAWLAEEIEKQFALLQFSNRFQEHFNFRQFLENRDPDHLLRDFTQLRGSSYTATAIRKAIRELFTTQKGMRSTAKKFLVVVTDGEKTGDVLDYAEVAEEANGAMITRFAVGAGLAFTSKSVQQELHAMASHPTTDHIFIARYFSGLRDIHAQLKEKICASRGQLGPRSTSDTPSTNTCDSHSDPQVLQKLEQVLRGLEQVKVKLDLLAARQGKCGRDSLLS